MVDIEKATADGFSLDHPAQGRSRLEKKSGAISAGRIMLSKAMGGVYYQRSLPGRCSEVIAIPSWKGRI